MYWPSCCADGCMSSMRKITFACTDDVLGLYDGGALAGLRNWPQCARRGANGAACSQNK